MAAPPALVRATFFIVVGAVLFVLFDRFGPYQSGSGYRPRPIERVGAASTTLERTFDGHFYTSGRIGGRADGESGSGTRVVFMIDTGASTIAIGDRLAERLDLGPCRPRQYATAAGTVWGCEAVAAFVEVAGLRIPDVRVAVLPGNDTVLLGMDVLRHFRIEQHGREMTLTPAAGRPGP